MEKRLRFENLAVGIVHAAQAALILSLSNGFSIPVTASFQDGPPGTGVGESQTLFEVYFGPAVALFLALAAIDHLLVASPGIVGWYERNLRRGINPARWLEYSLSASVMIILIAMLTGISDVYAVVGLFAANSAMILFGWLMERTNPPQRTMTDWLPFSFGSIIGIAPWIAITIAIVGAEVEFDGVPVFVYAIFVSLFVLFFSFAVNQFLQYGRIGPWRDYLFGEQMYIVLSLTAKTALAWQVFAGTLAS
jgi:hypothetical protein